MPQGNPSALDQSNAAICSQDQGIVEEFLRSQVATVLGYAMYTNQLHLILERLGFSSD